MTFFEASLKVLRDVGGGPLHFREIAQRAIESGYIKTSGRTPDATIGAMLYTHIKKLRPLVKNQKFPRSAEDNLSCPGK